MSKRKLKKKKVKIAYCTWCRKELKAGDYKSVGRDNFCSELCLSEWNVKQSIVMHQLHGQKSLVEKSGVSIQNLEEKAHQQKLEAIREGDLKKGEQVTVNELLEATSEENELRTIAGRMFGVKLRKTIHPAYYVAIGALFSLIVLFAGIKIVSFFTVPVEKKAVTIDTTVVIDTFVSYTKEISKIPVEKEPRTVRAPLSNKVQPLIVNQYDENLNFTRGDIDVPNIALTFDAGSHLEETGAILDTLKSRDIKCTFFLTGYYARRYKQMVIRMHAEGHEIGNHTWSHPHLTTFESSGKQITTHGVNKDIVLNELLMTDSLLTTLVGTGISRFWRAPYGEMNSDICRWAEEAGYKHIGWTLGTSWRTNLDTNDWVVNPQDAGFFYPEEVMDKILKFGNGTGKGLNGGIILMHAGTLRPKDKMVGHLGALIDSLHGRNYKLVKVSELIGG
jgi:peptidoglycan/xylan/chitin deacetylase (PgdA/CDA1 family)